MQKLTGALALGAACLLGGLDAGHAADLYGGSIKDGGYRPAIAASPTWYVRLDGGYAGHDTPVMVEDGIYDLLSPKIESTWTLGGGIGRYFTSTIRGDITYDHRFDADVSARMGAPGATYPGTRRFGLESDVILANLYYDFDLRRHFTPYVGVGLGAVYHRINAGKTIDGCGTCTSTINEASNWHVAGALMAGFSVALRDRMYIDAGYRFLYLGETKAGNITTTLNTNTSRGPTVEDIHAHELRLGLRYDIR
jgi:opacity protein-like surface antigen